MSPSSPREAGERGFTIIELTIAMAVLVIVLVLSGTLLISMKSFAQKQQSFAEPRQTARRALDYLAYYARGAGDMNGNWTDYPMPDALVTWYNNGSDTQACYNNVTDATLADLGTDILTLAKLAPGSIPIKIQGDWTGNHTSSNAAVLYTVGCGDSNDNTTNMSYFQQAVGWDSTANKSSLFLIYDPAGAWQYYAITGITTPGDCSQVSASPANVISVSLTAGGGSGVYPPGGVGDLTCSNTIPCFVTAGIQFVTFRVRTVSGIPRLEQLALPNRIFSATSDNPGTSFAPLLDNVEDLQVAYIFDNGQIWNSSLTSSRLLSASGNVPALAAQTSTPGTYDARNVRGLRISVVTRSDQPLQAILGGPQNTPTITPPEDSTVTYPTGYYHYRLTATVMFQNRILGS